jgi:hypothetical protein
MTPQRQSYLALILLQDQGSVLFDRIATSPDIHNLIFYRGVPSEADESNIGGSGSMELYGPGIYLAWGDRAKATAQLYARGGGKLLKFKLRHGAKWTTSNYLREQYKKGKISPDLWHNPTLAAKHLGYPNLLITRPSYLVTQDPRDLIRLN